MRIKSIQLKIAGNCFFSIILSREIFGLSSTQTIFNLKNINMKKKCERKKFNLSIIVIRMKC